MRTCPSIYQLITQSCCLIALNPFTTGIWIVLQPAFVGSFEDNVEEGIGCKNTLCCHYLKDSSFDSRTYGIEFPNWVWGQGHQKVCCPSTHILSLQTCGGIKLTYYEKDNVCVINRVSIDYGSWLLNIVRAFASHIFNLFYFTISKNYFTYYTISFYNKSNVPTFILKYNTLK